MCCCRVCRSWLRSIAGFFCGPLTLCSLLHFTFGPGLILLLCHASWVRWRLAPLLFVPHDLRYVLKVLIGELSDEFVIAVGLVGTHLRLPFFLCRKSPRLPDGSYLGLLIPAMLRATVPGDFTFTLDFGF